MNRPVTFAMVCAYAGVAAPFVLPKYADQIWDWRDYSAIAALILLMSWLLSPSRSAGLISPDGHENARDLISFRLGKTLKRVWCRLRGRL